jgi:hypothetical protein
MVSVLADSRNAAKSRAAIFGSVPVGLDIRQALVKDYR